MQSSLKNQASLDTNWPESPSEVLRIFSELKNDELIAAYVLARFSVGGSYKFFNIYDAAINEISDAAFNREIHFDPINKKWKSDQLEYSIQEQKILKYNISSEWRGIEFGKGDEQVYFLATHDDLINSIHKNSLKFPIKIGYTKQILTNRIKDLNTGNPDRLVKLFSIRVGNAYKFEKKIHSHLDIFRISNRFVTNKEWYFIDFIYLLKQIEKVINNVR
jgi:hypothetical protein